jgi:hypothetical protein
MEQSYTEGEVKQRLAAELQEAGFHINIKDLLAN